MIERHGIFAEIQLDPKQAYDTEHIGRMNDRDTQRNKPSFAQPMPGKRQNENGKQGKQNNTIA